MVNHPESMGKRQRQSSTETKDQGGNLGLFDEFLLIWARVVQLFLA